MTEYDHIFCLYQFAQAQFYGKKDFHTFGKYSTHQREPWGSKHVEKAYLLLLWNDTVADNQISNVTFATVPFLMTKI